MTKEEIRDYLAQNLSISVDTNYECDSVYLSIRLYLDGEEISSESINIK